MAAGSRWSGWCGTRACSPSAADGGDDAEPDRGSHPAPAGRLPPLGSADIPWPSS
jgi:hypothetical protein